MKMRPGITSVVFAVVLSLTGGLLAAERGRGRSGGGDAQWYADPERGWVKSDERRERRDERREQSRDRRSDDKDRDRGKNRGSWK
ncbi:MAG TPA: hypothetical protein VNL14_01390 [Candidatus Acidoferrales bacterium]|nr:hypothetical protein [Candidatus Acidoferrales bacterium]